MFLPNYLRLICLTVCVVCGSGERSTYTKHVYLFHEIEDAHLTFCKRLDLSRGSEPLVLPPYEGQQTSCECHIVDVWTMGGIFIVFCIALTSYVSVMLLQLLHCLVRVSRILFCILLVVVA